MENANTGRLGFTLIELLVVVLIIGILAAVALPQYNNAVLKAQVSEVESNLRTLYNATQVYHLASDHWPSQAMSELDIEVPACKCLSGEPCLSCAYHFTSVYGVNGIAYNRNDTFRTSAWDFFIPVQDGSAGGANVKKGILYTLRDEHNMLGFTEFVGTAAGSKAYQRP